MTSIDTTSTLIQAPDSGYAVDPVRLAAAGFLARYSARTLDACRHDLRGYFQWAAGVGLDVLEATRPHIELYRGWLEERGLAASTIDRRLSTVCLARRGPLTWRSVSVARVRSCAAETVNASTGVLHIAGFVQSGSAPGSDWSTLTCCERRSSWPLSTGRKVGEPSVVANGRSIEVEGFDPGRPTTPDPEGGETFEARELADQSRGGWVDPRRSNLTFAEWAGGVAGKGPVQATNELGPRRIQSAHPPPADPGEATDRVNLTLGHPAPGQQVDRGSLAPDGSVVSTTSSGPSSL